MEKLKAHVSQACRGWPADRVTEIVTQHLKDLILPYVYAEARAVNPDRALRRIATVRGWPVPSFSGV